MVIPSHNRNMMRVTLTLDPVDVDLLDRLGKLEGKNRSAELRSLLLEVRPMLQQTVAAFESAVQNREKLAQAAAAASMSEMQELLPEAQRLQNAVLGVLAKYEGLMAAPASNTGATLPNFPDFPGFLEKE